VNHLFRRSIVSLGPIWSWENKKLKKKNLVSCIIYNKVCILLGKVIRTPIFALSTNRIVTNENGFLN
jgi:hypothetical protein